MLSSMIDVKVDHLFSIGRTFDARIFAALKPWLMRGLPEVQTQNDGKESEKWGGRDSGSGLEAALRLFRWRSDTTEALETKRTGVGAKARSTAGGVGKKKKKKKKKVAPVY